MSDPLWSILIATVPWRQEKFLALLGSLLLQCEVADEPVEVVALQNTGQQSLARIRQRLLHEARGRYVSFVDDDDEVVPVYVRYVRGALIMGPDVVGFLQQNTGLEAPLTVLSLATADRPPIGAVDTEHGRAYVRPFSHRCPVLTELARQGGFLGRGEVSIGEDVAYEDAVLPLLRARGNNEAFIPRPLYHYRWSNVDTALNGPRPMAFTMRYARHRPPHVPSPYFRWVS